MTRYNSLLVNIVIFNVVSSQSKKPLISVYTFQKSIQKYFLFCTNPILACHLIKNNVSQRKILYFFQITSLEMNSSCFLATNGKQIVPKTHKGYSIILTAGDINDLNIDQFFKMKIFHTTCEYSLHTFT